MHYFVFDGFHHWARTFFDESAAAALFCFTGPWMALLLLLSSTRTYIMFSFASGRKFYLVLLSNY